MILNIFHYTACNIMAEGTAPFYTLQNYGTNRTCSISALFPASISIDKIDVGPNTENVNYDVSTFVLRLCLNS